MCGNTDGSSLTIICRAEYFGWIATSLARPALALTKQVARPIFQASRALQQGAASRLRAARDLSITQCAHQICRSSEITEAIVAG